ncbi:Phytocyanin domain-containing protein [Mycena venus]|uniref:Phytocyanin domain-containing protein n=1 Tax=Mycena venus TaxID=2733690 RepID=A0A8H6XD84_9AGAR|nr:Phytocyanin domain-containing protein [Mycena venus]
MVLIAPLIGAAVFLSGLTAALPTNSYDSGSSNSNSYGGSSDNSNSNYGSSSSSSSNYGSSNSNSNYGSSNSNSNYGGDSSNNYGGNSNNNYGGNSGNNYGGGNNYESTSTTMMMDSTSTTMMMDSTSTTTSQNYQTTSYGSGSNYWGGSGYEDCVNQCIAQFGGSSGGGSYQATATSGSYGSKGTGATHTVIVAPTKGVFRMMPFATNASVGDTIEFHWGADQHTVTKSSALLPCNKSSEAPVFASGEQNQSFVFTQVVNDTNPTFYYCGTPTHCEKGMFGIINPAMAAPGSPTSLGGMMQSMAANDSDLSAYAAYSSNVTSNNDAAAKWGANFDMANMPDWSHSLFATNVLFTRAVLGMNSEVLQADGSTDLSSVANTPLMLPMDISQPLNAAAAPQSSDANAAAASTPASTPAATPAGAAGTDPAAAAQTSTKSNGASSVASPRLLVAGVVVLATIFAL